MRVPIQGGDIAVEVQGDGPLVLLVPGMGETRRAFRHLIGPVSRAGYRVAAMDLRGHGASDTSFDSYDDDAGAQDALTVIDRLGVGPAVIIGSSMGAAIGVIAAAARPEAVAGLVLIGPFVRDHGGALVGALMRLALARPWGPAVWSGYYKKLFGEIRTQDHDAHVADTLARLRQPERWRAFQCTARTSHAPAERALDSVSAPALVVMGDRDPDFKDPGAEARWIADALSGDFAVVPGAGHYPMGEQPEFVRSLILPFLSQATQGWSQAGVRADG